MSIISRKLQKINKSYFVSLPKTWIKNLNLDKNSIIDMLVCDDGSIKISPKFEKQEQALDEIILQSSRYVARDIVKYCLSGVEKIIIVSKEDFQGEICKDILWFVNHLPNAEIIERDKRRIIVSNFGYKRIPTRKIIQRLLYLICEIFENIQKEQPTELKNNFDSVRRLYFVLVTHIRTYLRTGLYVSEDRTFTPLEAMDYRMFCEKIERIGLILRDFIYIKGEYNGFFAKVEEFFTEVMDAFLKKNYQKACEAWFKRDDLVQQAQELSEGMNCEKKVKLNQLLTIIEYCKDMADLI
ncbi:MAG: phosphate uptake regulator PhoU [Candidatus Lokiarchaeota archaeon]|nr:phosphate uptake regulator PhoU [Candidatus Lokiarchaeota archaeon]